MATDGLDFQQLFDFTPLSHICDWLWSAINQNMSLSRFAYLSNPKSLCLGDRKASQYIWFRRGPAILKVKCLSVVYEEEAETKPC